MHLCLLTGIWVKLGKILVMRNVREIKLTHNELSNVDWLHNLCHFCAAYYLFIDHLSRSHVNFSQCIRSMKIEMLAAAERAKSDPQWWWWFTLTR